ncbi:MAG TPA: gliding motility-associated C-terminal domain-containing protein, partial [Cryomorphaceae bacterium]|nr:gliding motility-associated C-terminal domain-containing protein [Cryomorphaceae bacterium]
QANPTFPFYFEGAIDDFWYWNRELTEEEIFGFCDVTAPCSGSLSIPDVTGCINEPIDLTFDLENENSEIESYLWEFDDGSSSDAGVLALTYPVEITQGYTLTITTENGCEYSANGLFTVNAAPELPEIETVVVLCDGEQFTLEASDYPDWAITDSDGEEVDLFTTEETGVYSFTFSSVCSSEIINVSVTQVLVSEYLDLDDQIICTGSDVVVEVPDWPSIGSESNLLISFDANTPEPYQGEPVTFTFSDEGIYTIEIMGSILNCPVSQTFQIEVVSPPESFAQNTFDICGGDIIDLDFSDLPFTVLDVNGEPVASIQLSSGGTYIFTGQNACSSFEEIITVNETVINPPSFGNFEFLCEGQDTIAIGFNSDDFDYLWDSGSQDPSILVLESGQYGVTVTTGVCAESFVFQINDFPYSPSTIFDFPAVDLCLEGQTNINFPPQFGPYSFSDTLIGYTYTATETESLSFTYSDGCYTYPDTLFISVESCLCPVWVPNVFTPDEDGLNDFFKPVLECDVYDYRMLIFNRWGREVFQSNAIEIPWR